MPVGKVSARLGVLDNPTSRPFINAFKQAWSWQGDRGGAQWDTLVSGGYMTSGGQLISVAPNSGGFRTRMFFNMPAQAGGTGRWRMRWEGIATVDLYGVQNVTRPTANEINFDFVANGSSWVDVVVRTINPAGGQIRSFSVVHQDDIADFDAGEIYRKQYLEEIKNYDTLRFDEWIGILRSEGEGGLRITSWESRALPTDEIFHRFVPYEYMVELCKETNSNMWVCLPTAATNDHMVEAAKLIKNLLPEPLKVYAEYSTKTWDFSGTPQAHYCAEKGREAFGTSSGSEFRNWYGMRSAQMAQFWRQIWGTDDRLQTVVQHQADWVGGEVDILEAPLWRQRSNTRGLPVYVEPSSVIDVFTVHAQIDGGMAYGGRTNQIETWRTTLSRENAFNNLRDQLLRGTYWAADRTITALTPKWEHYVKVANSKGMTLASYEVGNHLNGIGGTATTRQFIHDFTVSPQMGEVYATAFNRLREVGFSGPLCMSVECRLPDQNISHGLQRWLGDHNPAWTAVNALMEDKPDVVVPTPVDPTPVEPEPIEPEVPVEPMPTPSTKRTPSTAPMLHCLNGHSLTDVIANSGLEGWPGNLPNLFISQFGESTWKYPDTFFKDTIPGSPLRIRWNDNSIGRTGIAKFDSLVTTETVPPAKVTTKANELQMKDTLDYLVRFAENTIANGKGRKEVIMWAGWPNKDGNPEFGNFRQSAVEYGRSFRFFSEYATWKVRRKNSNVPTDWRIWTFNTNAWWIKFFDDIQARTVPGITDHRILFQDDIHLTPVGEYALSVFFYTCLYQKDTRTLSYKPKPAAMSAALDEYFKRIAFEVASAESSIGMGGTVNSEPTFNPSVHGDPLDPSYVHVGDTTPTPTEPDPIDPPIEPEVPVEEPETPVEEPEVPTPVEPTPIEDKEELSMADRQKLSETIAEIVESLNDLKEYLDKAVTEPETPVEPVEPPVEPETPPVVTPPTNPPVTPPVTNPQPVDTYPTLPSGFVKPANIALMSNNWKNGNLVLPTWSSGNPALVEMRDNGSAILTARNVNGTWNTGMMQIFKPRVGQGRWDAIFSVDKPSGVAAFFTYAEDGTEFDFELVRRPGGSLAWQLNVHMFSATKQRQNPSKLIFVPTTAAELAKPHKYSIVHSATSTQFLIDDVKVGEYFPSDVPNAVWSTTARNETFLGTWRHTGWSGWTSADYGNESQMTVYGVQVPGLPTT